MNVKQFKKRWLNHYIEPELFYMPLKSKLAKLSKLIIRFDLYEILKSDLSGFYDTVTPLKNVNVKFVVLNSSRNIVYISPNNFANSTVIELPNGKYTIKLLFSAYGFVGGENQTVTISGETLYTIKIYKRHFKAMTVTGGNFDTYNSTKLSYYGDVDATGQADEVVALSQIDVYELKWDKWEKILNYDCLPVGFAILTHNEYYYVNGQIRGIRNFQTQYFGGIIMAESGTLNGQSYSKMFSRWENGKGIFTTVSAGNTSTSQYTSSQMGLDNLSYIENAVALYRDGKTYSDEDSIDDDFFNKYKGNVLLKYQEENTNSIYFLSDPRKITYTVPTDFVKIYLPTVNYFNADLLKERMDAERHGELFWKVFLQAVKINEDGVIQNYNNKMIYNGLEVTQINSVNIFWYSEDYNKFSSN